MVLRIFSIDGSKLILPKSEESSLVQGRVGNQTTKKDLKISFQGQTFEVHVMTF